MSDVCFSGYGTAKSDSDVNDINLAGANNVPPLLAKKSSGHAIGNTLQYCEQRVCGWPCGRAQKNHFDLCPSRRQVELLVLLKQQKYWKY